ncbi:hypothetical protein QA649_19725 [Bradyrhizobium sp. CB1717]|uniref:hypothetical protein n=1 Tax=Bradyrhizobium sp. CB1717 TaxID=3039154 RepID=UPI0024B0E3B3|nr:hypothetical protein [Bradyrhizobium sp. CB1717]WFU28361.1 hypothetical protein QA649_19725 [Bradyrhizobium sp. CB1717]
MNFLPGPAQTTAICLSVALPLLLLCYARITAIRGTGRRFRLGCLSVVVLFVIACVAIPGPRHLDDVVSGVFLLATAMMLCYVLFSLLAWGFTLTLLTALARAGSPLTLEQWAAAYMQGGDLGTFARNRLKLLIGSGMVMMADGKLAPTAKGLAVAHFVKFVRFSTGLG